MSDVIIYVFPANLIFVIFMYPYIQVFWKCHKQCTFKECDTMKCFSNVFEEYHFLCVSLFGLNKRLTIMTTQETGFSYFTQQESRVAREIQVTQTD